MGTAPQNLNPINIDRDGSIKYKLTIQVGDYQEFIWGERIIRVAVIEIVKDEFQFSFSGKEKKEGIGVAVDFNMGGGLVYCGEYCKKLM